MESVQDVYNQFDSLHGKVLDNVNFMTGSAVIQDANSQQLVYEAFSNVSATIT